MAGKPGGSRWFWLIHVNPEVASSRTTIGNLIEQAEIQKLVRRATGRELYRFSNFRPAKRWKVPQARPPREGAISAISSLVCCDPVVSPKMKEELAPLIWDHAQFLEVNLEKPVEARWHRAQPERADSLFVVVPLIQLECIDWRKTNWRRVAVSPGTYLMDSEHADVPAETVLDLSRVPVNVHLFSPHGTAGGLVVSEALARVIKKAKASSFACVQAKYVGKPRRKLRLQIARVSVVGEKRPVWQENVHPWLRGVQVEKRGQPWTAAHIEMFERAVVAKMPGRIRTFVLQEGSCLISGQMTLGDSGTSAAGSSRSSVKLARRARREWKNLPAGVVPIADDGRGGYFALDIRKQKNGDCPVVAVDHELNDPDATRVKARRVAATYAKWIKVLDS